MRLWLRYLYEKRRVICLYLLTVFLFVALGALYHLENLDKLLYAGLLTFVIWALAGCYYGFQYVRRSRRLENLVRHFEKSGDLLLREYGAESPGTAEGNVESAEDYREAGRILLSRVFEAKEAERIRGEERTAECRDYYVMWTHQIKTPIAALRLLLENEESRSRNSFLMREELFKIEQYAEMALTFQRLENISSDLILQENDLYSMLKKAVKKYAVLFINKGLGLELQEMNLKIVTDEKWFIFCVEQLLSNSIKYTAQGKVMILARASEEGEKERKVLLTIEDTGIGIRPEDLPRIFKRGFTGYNGRLDKKATGIGLYLCRKVFSHLGITAGVESEEGKGTKVKLTIPCGKGRSRATVPEPPCA